MAIISFIILNCVFGTLIGRYCFGRWFNHLSLYAWIWTLVLVLYQIGMIHYYPLEPETWLVIFDGWAAFVLGAVTIYIAKKAMRGETHEQVNIARDPEQELHLLEKVLWILCAISSVAVIQHWLVLLHKFGSITNVITYGGLVYMLRVEGEITGEVPYFDSLALSATMFAGCYTALKGRISILGIAPILITVFQSVSGMGRGELLLAAILFLTGYLLGKRATDSSSKRHTGKIKIAFSLGVALAILVGAAELVRANRAINEDISGASRSLEQLRGASFITPSIYLYFSGHPGVLNQYLKTRDEKTGWGENTLNPIYHIIAKLEGDASVNGAEQFYPIPIRINTGTYLRELDADFGVAGILVFPYLLGIGCSYFWFRFTARRSYVDLAWFSHLLVIVGFSFLLIATRWGFWVVSLLAALVTASYIERKFRRGTVAVR